MRGVDIGRDHTLLPVKPKLELRKLKVGRRSPQVDINKLKDPTIMSSFQVEVENRFAILGNIQKLNIEQFNTTLVEAGKKILGLKKKEECVTPKTWVLIEQRRKTKKKILTTKSVRLKDQLKTHSIQDKEVKKSARKRKMQNSLPQNKTWGPYTASQKL